MTENYAFFFLLVILLRLYLSPKAPGSTDGFSTPCELYSIWVALLLLLDCVVPSLRTLSSWNSLYLALVGLGQPSLDSSSRATPLPFVSFHVIHIFVPKSLAKGQKLCLFVILALPLVPSVYSLCIFDAMLMSWVYSHYFITILPVQTSLISLSFRDLSWGGPNLEPPTY